MKRDELPTREGIFQAAIKVFAAHGYAGASVQDIVDAARCTKPALYYYFDDKAGLYQALVDDAYNRSFDLLQRAHASASDPLHRLERLVAASFRFTREQQDASRILFATAFAARGELPPGVRFLEKAQRNFDLFQDAIQTAIREKALAPGPSVELTQALYGLFVIHIMGFLVKPQFPLNDALAARVVDLFVHGASAKRS